MIGLLEGQIARKTPQSIILKTGGVGYSVHVPAGLLPKIAMNETVLLQIHTHVTDDAIGLYGFITPEELILFELLLGVSGIGPRTALAIVDQGVGGVQQAISTADVDFFTQIPRLGKKNSQKIIIELKNKLGSINELDLAGADTDKHHDITQALLSMGFDKKEITLAVKQLTGEFDTLEKKLRQALKLLAK